VQVRQGDVLLTPCAEPQTVHPELRPLLDDDEYGNPQFGEPQELTVRNAIASQFGLRGEEYAPEVET
jgi:hypothetical protein